MIHYKQGDATNPNETGVIINAHCVNDLGIWGGGYVIAVSKKWPRPEQCYRDWEAGNGTTDMTGGQLLITPPLFRIGEVQLVQVEPEMYVANMVAQKGIGPKSSGGSGKPGRPPVRYEALEMCLNTLAQMANKLDAIVVMPRICCERAGGSWKVVESIIDRTLLRNSVQVVVYDFPGGSFNP